MATPLKSIGKARTVLRKWTENLQSKLSEDEKWDSAQRSCELCVELARVEEEKKFHAKEYADRIKKLKTAIDKETRAVVTGQTDREAEIVEEYDAIENEVFRTRLDTGEMIGRRKATESERQGSIVEFGAD